MFTSISIYLSGNKIFLKFSLPLNGGEFESCKHRRLVIMQKSSAPGVNPALRVVRRALRGRRDCLGGVRARRTGVADSGSISGGEASVRRQKNSTEARATSPIKECWTMVGVGRGYSSVSPLTRLAPIASLCQRHACQTAPRIFQLPAPQQGPRNSVALQVRTRRRPFAVWLGPPISIDCPQSYKRRV